MKNKSRIDRVEVEDIDIDLKNDDQKRVLLTIVLGIVAIVVLIAVSISSLISGDMLIAILDFTAAVLLAVILFLFKFSSYERQCRYVAVAMMYCLYAYLFFSGAADGMTYMWHYTFPFFATFLIGANHGAIATLILFIPVFIYVVNDAMTPGQGFYSSTFAIRFLPSVSVALIFSYLFERERERFKRMTLEAYKKQNRVIEERTKQLKQEVEDREKIASRLQQSQKMEAIGIMAGGIAHDLNNILAGIVSYPELIRLKLPADSSLRPPLEKIETAGKRAAAVVDDMLTLARNVASVKETTNLNILITDFIGSLEWKKIKGNYPNVEVIEKLDKHDLFISCSQVHIRKCLMNLIFNAVEASAPDGQVVITTGVASDSKLPGKRGDGSNGFVYFTVQDSGPGIGSKHIDHIFEPFYSTKKLGHSGSGLGLSVVWNTVKEHDGEVIVGDTSAGASFQVLLPVVDVDFFTEEATQPSSLESLQGSGALLIVDDEPELREIGFNIGEMLGYSVVLAQSGEEAVEIVQKQEFDAIILDMLLGEGINGRETYEKIIAIRPEQKAIIASGYSTGTDAQRTLELGAHSIIKKPYSLEELGLAIKDCLSNPRIL